jgi:hypothetical protein
VIKCFIYILQLAKRIDSNHMFSKNDGAGFVFFFFWNIKQSKDRVVFAKETSNSSINSF